MAVSGRLRGRRGALVGAGVVVLVAVVAVLALVLRGDGDGLGGVRSSPVVAVATRSPSDSVKIELRDGAGRAAVLAALDELPEDARFVSVDLGRISVDIDRERPAVRAGLVDLMLAAAGVRAPFVTLEISSNLGIDARVDTREQAAPLALELAERVPTERVVGIESSLRVAQLRSERPGESIVFLELQAGFGTERALAAVRASRQLADRTPRVSGSSVRTDLRVSADSLDDVADAWDEATAAIRAAGADEKQLRIYVDRSRSATDDAGRPYLLGEAGDDPATALALLRRLQPRGDAAYATADLSYAQVDASSAADGRASIETAAAADVERFRVTWRSTRDDTAWMGLTAGVGRSMTSIDDSADVALALLPGIARARAAGIRGIHWDRQAVDGTPRLRVARPTWLPVGEALDADDARSRRLARAIRGIGWRGVARFDVIVGECGRASGTSTVARITSTSTGRATAVEPGASCTEEADVAPMGEAWDSTAD